ncbi:MAG: hypothetical protein A2265_08300, partial [Bacteroidetes bacterium RIFOXYA12_FULL_33_9]
KLTQTDFALKIGVTRSVIGAYEEGRAVPKISSMQLMSHLFDIAIDDLINNDLSKGSKKSNLYAKGDKMRVLSVATHADGRELVNVVSQKATAGYLTGYSDPEYIESLPKFSLPLNEISRERTYRVFQLNGDSMLPLQDKSYVICEYIDNWLAIKDTTICIVATIIDGITCKRIYNEIAEKETITLKPDNLRYAPYSIKISEVLEIWKVIGYVSFSLPEKNVLSLQEISDSIHELKEEVRALKK